MQTVFPSSTDSVDSGNWVNFLECKRVLWNNIRSFERHASMFWNYLDWSQLFFCEQVRMFSVFWEFWLVTVGFLWQKVRIFLFFSKREMWTYCSVPYVSKNQSKCFQMFFFLAMKSWKPRPKIEIPKVWGVSCIPQPSAIYYVRIYAHICFLGGGGRIEGFLFPCLPIIVWVINGLKIFL